MGFFRGPDKIGILSHSAGVITLGLPALSSVNRYTVRGQQYDFGALSRTISADVTLAANTLYFIYAHVISGVVNLRISASAPSVYKNSNPTSDLIGAFYADGRSSVGFGAFVTITGTPESNVYAHSPVYTSTGGGMTVGTILVNDLFVKRIGDLCFATWVFRQSVAGVAGSGDYRASLPFEVDTNKAKVGLGTTQGDQGSGRLNTAVPGGEYGGYIILYDSANFGMFLHDESTGPTLWSSGFGAFSNTNMDMGGNFNYPVSGWSNTPLKDL